MLRTLPRQQSSHPRDEYDFKHLHRELRRRAWPFSDMHVTEKPGRGVRQCGSNQFSPVGRNGIQHIVNLACESDLGHRQREARGLLNCRSRRHG